MIAIHKIELPVPGMEQLRIEALAERYDFIEKLILEWSSGVNRFDAQGEILCGYLDRGFIAAVGGLNRDPFVARPEIGRIRRVYVRRAWRNQGIGESLVTALVQHARESFRCVRLRSDNPNAARLYERMGFSACSDTNATHILILDREP
jgi:GNAT superfamily N-acetyltransferase